MLTTLKVSSGHDKWIGYQFLYGFGLGVGFQQATTACRTVLARQDVPIAMSGVFFMQTFGGAVFITIAQAVLQGILTGDLQALGIDPIVIVNTGATQLRSVIHDPKMLQAAIETYSKAVTSTFWIAVALGILSLVGSCCVQWRSINEAEKKPEEKKGEERV
jgi:hypothetical protein